MVERTLRADAGARTGASVPGLRSERALALIFLVLIGMVPVSQTLVEWWRGERVQFTDVFRTRPTSQNLRQFEDTLEEKSVFQQRLRPQVQRLLFTSLRDTGSKGMLGRENWLFYRPDVRYLIEPDRPEPEVSSGRWVLPAESSTRRASVVRAIVRFRDQLSERGIRLLVVPVPGKPSIHPERLTARAASSPSVELSPTLSVMKQLRVQNVQVVDLFARFDDAKTGGAPLYLARDTHWTPEGARVAAETVAQTLRQAGLAPAPSREFTTRAVHVQRWGDILEMMQIPGLHEVYPAEPVACLQVLDPTLGPMVSGGSDRPGTYRYPGQKASVLVLGDSFIRIYQFAEPRTLGESPAENAAAGEQGTKRLLPGSAGFVSHLALALQAPVDAIYSDGGASTDVRRKLSTNPEILEGKQVVIWEFVERDVALGRDGWQDVPLPPALEP